MIDEGCGVNHESYTAILSAYSRNGLFDKAFSLLEEMNNSTDCKPDVHTYSILIKSCLQVLAFDKVDSLLSVMASQGIKPNTITYNTLIDAYGKARKLVSPFPFLNIVSNYITSAETMLKLPNVDFFLFICLVTKNVNKQETRPYYTLFMVDFVPVNEQIVRGGLTKAIASAMELDSHYCFPSLPSTATTTISFPYFLFATSCSRTFPDFE